MSSQSDDLTKITAIPAAAASSATAPDAQVLLENGGLERYVLGTLRPEEIDAAKQFFSDPIRARILRDFQVWAEQEPGMSPPDRSQTLTEFWEKICAHEQAGTPAFLAAAKRAGRQVVKNVRLGHSNTSLGKQTLRWWGGPTAAVVATALVVLFSRTNVRNTGSTTHTYVTQVGERATVTLSDGTRVTLAPRSALRLVQFGLARRTVDLSGEAYFESSRASDAPFVVRSGPAETRVLGTAFLIRSVDGDHHIHVAVADGKVSVTTAFGQRTLSAGDVGDVTDSTVQIGHVDDITTDIVWKNGEVVFRHTPVPKVLETLSRWYGYQFRVTDSALTQQRVNIVMSSRSSAEALDVLEQILAVNLTVVGDTITLTSQPSRPARGKPRTKGYDVWTPNREVGR
jgi:ferric-dicitrate binding protein FerR (iron transport regulator)